MGAPLLSLLEPSPAREPLSAPSQDVRWLQTSPAMVQIPHRRVTAKPTKCDLPLAPGGSYLSPAFGWSPDQFLPPPRSLQPPRSAPGRVRRPRLVASKSASESRRVKREAESQASPVLHHP